MRTLSSCNTDKSWPENTTHAAIPLILQDGCATTHHPAACASPSKACSTHYSGMGIRPSIYTCTACRLSCLPSPNTVVQTSASLKHGTCMPLLKHLHSPPRQSTLHKTCIRLCLQSVYNPVGSSRITDARKPILTIHMCIYAPPTTCAPISHPTYAAPSAAIAAPTHHMHFFLQQRHAAPAAQVAFSPPTSYMCSPLLQNQLMQPLPYITCTPCYNMFAQFPAPPTASHACLYF
jgi:hypothetical protein